MMQPPKIDVIALTKREFFLAALALRVAMQEPVFRLGLQEYTTGEELQALEEKFCMKAKQLREHT